MCRPIRSVIILVINKSDSRYAAGRPVFVTNRLITGRIKLHSVLLPLLSATMLQDFNSKNDTITAVSKFLGFLHFMLARRRHDFQINASVVIKIRRRNLMSMANLESLFL